MRIKTEAKLGGDHHSVTHRRQGLPYQLLVGERPVHLGGVEEGDAKIHGVAKELDHLGPFASVAVGPCHAHAAETQRRDFESALSQCARLHHCSPFHSASVRLPTSEHPPVALLPATTPQPLQ